MTPTPAHPLAYYTDTTGRAWRSPELSWEQAELNAGAQRIYAARRRRLAPRLPAARPHMDRAALPAPFAPPPLALPAPPGRVGA